MRWLRLRRLQLLRPLPVQVRHRPRQTLRYSVPRPLPKTALPIKSVRTIGSAIGIIIIINSSSNSSTNNSNNKADEVAER